MNEEEKNAIEELSKKAVICNYEERDYPNMICFKKDMIIVLNLIEKLQKENEELKQDRNNNYQMIALAQNEVLGYMQGYEDGKKLKRSAVACVVENQQYYIIKKEIEHYKEYIEKLQKENEEKDKQIKKALDLIFEYGQIDGGHHKAWVIDQIVRILIKDKYDEWVKNYIYDEETGDTYTWDKGIAP